MSVLDEVMMATNFWQPVTFGEVGRFTRLVFHELLV